MSNPSERDLWWEARQRTARESKSFSSIVRNTVVSLPGSPTKVTFAALGSLGREKSGIVIDLNKYRAGRDLQKYIDAGVDAFALRIGGPLQWAMNEWRYTEDPTFRPYMEQCDKLGVLNQTIGYILHNPFELWVNDYNTHIDLINEWTGGGYMPAALALDHEVAQCWQGGQKITASAHNLVGSLSKVTDLMTRRFKKKVAIYTARWFVNTYYRVEHEVFLDNINRPEIGKNRLAWMAWYPQVFPENADFQKVIEQLLVPSGTQLANLLQIGSHTSADLWQFSDRVKLPGDPTGVDCNVTMGSLDQFRAAFGLGAASVPEPEPDPSHNHAADIVKLEEVIASLKAG
jgi:hypothetical protein